MLVAARNSAFAYKGKAVNVREVGRELGARYVSFDELLETADVVSLHCPLNDETKHLINADRLKQMRSDAFLVNTTRGPVVDEQALVDALRAGEIAGAGLDVFEEEPKVNPGLLELENAVLIPHLGSATIETRTAMGLLAAENAVAVLSGAQPPTPEEYELRHAGVQAHNRWMADYAAEKPAARAGIGNVMSGSTCVKVTRSTLEFTVTASSMPSGTTLPSISACTQGRAFDGDGRTSDLYSVP